jgi:DNA adenine methylase/adenine-specific DNA-methyltransferase
MGSKYRLAPHLAEVFADIGGSTALDAFSGSGVVSYLLKSLGFTVTSNDFLHFPTQVTNATVANQRTKLGPTDLERIVGPNADGRSFISDMFDGLYFDKTDHMFLDSAWSNISQLQGRKKSLALSALILAAAKKQPRGVFTFTDRRYDDGRRDLRLTMQELFLEASAAYNGTVFESNGPHAIYNRSVAELPDKDWDVVYLDPPYAPPKDDNCYVKRYHFLEGLSTYWADVDIMHETKTKKLRKRFTPFSYKRTVEQALADTFDQFKASTIVLSYGGNAVPEPERVIELLKVTKGHVDVREIDHRYHFGTHSQAKRRKASEYLFVGY